MDAQTKKRETYCLRERASEIHKAKSTTALGIEPMSVRIEMYVCKGNDVISLTSVADQIHTEWHTTHVGTK